MHRPCPQGSAGRASSASRTLRKPVRSMVGERREPLRAVASWTSQSPSPQRQAGALATRQRPASPPSGRWGAAQVPATRACGPHQCSRWSHRIFQSYATSLPTSLSCIASMNPRILSVETGCGTSVRRVETVGIRCCTGRSLGTMGTSSGEFVQLPCKPSPKQPVCEAVVCVLLTSRACQGLLQGGVPRLVLSAQSCRCVLGPEANRVVSCCRC
jgi:hypothetical protein